MQMPEVQTSAPLQASPSSQLASIAHSISASTPASRVFGKGSVGAEDSPLAQPVEIERGTNSRAGPSRGRCSSDKATSRTNQDALCRGENHVVNRTLSGPARGVSGGELVSSLVPLRAARGLAQSESETCARFLGGGWQRSGPAFGGSGV